MRSLRFCFLLSFCLALSALLRAQSTPAPVTQITLGQSIVALNGPWKFHIGDNPQWADPNFDDSSWENVDLSENKKSIDPAMGIEGFAPGWTAKGHPGYSGFAWYRIRVRITGADEPLALLTPWNVDDGFQVFTNGRLIGSFGNFDRPIPTLYISRPVLFDLPAGTVTPADRTGVLALRFYMTPATLLLPMAGGLHGPPVLGFSSAITAGYHVAWEDLYRGTSSLLVEIGLYLLFAILIFMLYAFDHAETILLWPLAACLVGANNYGILFLTSTTELMTLLQRTVILAIAVPVFLGLWLMTWRVYFDLREKRWLRNAIGVLVIWAMITGLFFQVLLVIGEVSRTAFALAALEDIAVSAAVVTLIGVIGWLGWRRPHREQPALFLALLFFAIGAMQPVLEILHVPTNWFPHRFPIFLQQFCDFGMLICFSLVLLRRFRSSQRRQQAMEEDMKQAQEVQQVLIPLTLPQVPGLTIESEYRPAREVGGDFFQILPDSADGSVLIVVGDVTGHGLQAGMLVALIVGVIRNEIGHTYDPLVVLNALNRTLCGRGHAHATCLALRIEADGAATLANAGHLPPYLNGKELAMEGALPLGMIDGAEFSVMRFDLAPDDTLMLMSDGIAEAQNDQGQMFGFDRIHALLQKPVTAAEVATVAQNFGQEDDISVLRIQRSRREVRTASAEPALATR